jgi:hypothetical protein
MIDLSAGGPIMYAQSAILSRNVPNREVGDARCYGIGIREQQIRPEERALRSFSEVPGQRRTARRLLCVRAVAGRVPAHGALDDQLLGGIQRADFGRERRGSHVRQIVDANRQPRHRANQIHEGFELAALLVERDAHVRGLLIRIGDQQIGVEERAGRALGEEVGGIELRQRHVVAGAADIADEIRGLADVSPRWRRR